VHKQLSKLVKIPHQKQPSAQVNACQVSIPVADDGVRRPKLRLLSPQADRECCTGNLVRGISEYLAEIRRDTDPGVDRLYPLPRQKLTNNVRQGLPDMIRSRPHTQDAQRLQHH
jgi:hypothetical protein